ncbi:MAG: hypothetical protein K2N75_07790 [Helicobacter sp.]|uniref:hypothetical protein n=1 Tax=Helicobacter sp. TaxID=218 RepID=UPI0023D042F0|nr:hypothetical protein [Helicobacter sp.]MDE7175922.1 hypothetical protein [Helicobacter sp.]
MPQPLTRLCNDNYPLRHHEQNKAIYNLNLSKYSTERFFSLDLCFASECYTRILRLCCVVALNIPRFHLWNLEKRCGAKAKEAL